MIEPCGDGTQNHDWRPTDCHICASHPGYTCHICGDVADRNINPTDYERVRAELGQKEPPR